MNEKVLILESEDYSRRAIEKYRALGTLETYSPASDVSLISALVVRLGFHLDSAFLAGFPSLKYIVSPTTGLNHIDVHYCRRADIEVLSLQGELEFLDSISSTAEMTFALILSLVRRVKPAASSVARGKWNRDLFKGRQLQSMTLGIIGFGRVGRQLASYANAFGMGVLITDRIDDEPIEDGVSLETVLRQSDIVCLTANFTEANREMIGEEEFSQMKDGSFFVNTARGELVNEVALLDNIKKSKFAGVGLDVLSNEHSLTQNRILQYYRQVGLMENLIITPHISGCTADAMEETENFMADKLVNFLQSAK